MQCVCELLSVYISSIIFPFPVLVLTDQMMPNAMCLLCTNASIHLTTRCFVLFSSTSSFPTTVIISIYLLPFVLCECRNTRVSVSSSSTHLHPLSFQWLLPQSFVWWGRRGGSCDHDVQSFFFLKAVPRPLSSDVFTRVVCCLLAFKKPFHLDI